MVAEYIENKVFSEMHVGDHAEAVRVLRREDIELFAAMSGDLNPTHLDDEYAKAAFFHEVVGHGMWGGALISAVIGTELPGAGTIYLDQSLKFLKPVVLGDTVTVRVEVKELRPERQRVVLYCTCTNQAGERVIEGEALVKAPVEKVRRPRVVLPTVSVYERGARYRQLMGMTAGLHPAKTAVVHPCDEVALSGALEAAKRGHIIPILVGPKAKIEAAAEQLNADLTGIEIVHVAHSHAAAATAVSMVLDSGVEALMKGSLHTDELMEAVLVKQAGLRTGRRMSHVFALDVPNYDKPLFITDAAINIVPDLETKRDIIQNAIDLCRALGYSMPKVALLSAVETVTSRIPSTLDAAALCKMADRGQIKGAILDGPLAFDNAISKVAAATKHIVSDVAGDADILVVPDLEAGNMLAKQLIFLAGAEAAGIVLGARVPIVLTSRADSEMARLASCALAQILVHHQRAMKH